MVATAAEIGTVTSLPMPTGSVLSDSPRDSAPSLQPTPNADKPTASTISSTPERAIRGTWREDNTVTSIRVRPLPECQLGHAGDRVRRANRYSRDDGRRE